MAFKLPLSPELQAYIDATAKEMQRIFALPDRWLGETLINLARKARQEFPEELGNPNSEFYDTNLVWNVLPEIGRRLGVRNFRPNENGRAEIRMMPGIDLRNCASSCVTNSLLGRPSRIKYPNKVTAVSLLTHEPCNGNPIAIALDRICPAALPGTPDEDWMARHMREISFRRGYPATQMWRPELQSPRNEDITTLGPCP